MAKQFIGNVKGVGIKAIYKEYYASTSSTEVVGGEWSKNVPTLSGAEYLWSRWKVELTDAREETTTPVTEGVAGVDVASLADLISNIAPNGNMADARQNMNYIGSNPIASTTDDTPENWAALKTGYAVFTANRLKNQPTQYGFVENIVAGNSISQRFISTNAGVWYRTGNASTGWNNKWHDFERMSYYVDSNNTFETTLNGMLSDMVDTSVRQIQFHDPQGLYDNKFIGTLWRYGENYAVLDAFTYTGLSARKCLYNGTWNPWEWINPPMLAGVEYRTTKRFENKPVYARYVDLGNLPEAGAKGWLLQGLHIDKVVDFKVVAHKATGAHKMQLPYISNDGEIVASARLTEESGYDGTYIKVNVYSTFKDYTGQAYIEYTKV